MSDFRRDYPFYLLLLPAVVLVFVFSYLPMPGIIMAFKNMGRYGNYLTDPWADNHGFQHFITIFSDSTLYIAIWNTFYLNVLGLLIGFPAPIIFALLLNELRTKWFKRTVQTFSYLPHFLSWISVTAFVSVMFAQYGSFNDIRASLGLSRVEYLADPKNFIPFYLFLTVWKGMGFNSIIFLASIASINSELYEAARIDSANRFQQVLYITLPSILPTTMILLILQMGQLFGSNFELVYGLQSLYFDTEVIATVVYKRGIKGSGEMEMTTALGLMQSVVALALTMGANKISKKVSEISLW